MVLGTLLTFVQFLFVAITGYVSQFDATRPPFFIRPNRVPIRRWLINIVLFFSINLLNNHAFSYDISVPVHIILRSGGSITTIVAGSLYGKRYSQIQVTAVVLLTIGVITAAWSDAQTKVRWSSLALNKWPRKSDPIQSNPQPNRRMRAHRQALAQVWEFFSLLKPCRQSWAYIQRRLTDSMDPSGKRTSSTRTYSRFRSSCPLRNP